MLELNFLFFSDTSLLILIILLNSNTRLNITSLLHQWTSSYLTRKLIAACACNKDKNKRMPCGQKVLQRYPSLEVSNCSIINCKEILLLTIINILTCATMMCDLQVLCG